MIIEFDSAVYRWQARTDADWYFAGVPDELSEQVRELQNPTTRGFGAVRVQATIGDTTWRTSIFPGADGAYSLPLKRAVRDAEALAEGSATRVHLEILDV